MDIIKELTRLHELAGETTALNFRALMQNELRKLIEQAQEEAAQQPRVPDKCPQCAGVGFVKDSIKRICLHCDGTGIRR